MLALYIELNDLNATPQANLHDTHVQYMISMCADKVAVTSNNYHIYTLTNIPVTDLTLVTVRSGADLFT